MSASAPAAPPTGPAALPGFSATFQTRYRIERLLGRGGFGEVYLGEQVALELKVAIKTLRALDAPALERFRIEGKLLSRLSHPRVVAVHDAGEDGEVPFLVCEFVEGSTLGQLLEKGPLELARALEITIGVLDGLSGAHKLGIHHRDIKPDNVFVTPAGEVKIGDFGLAGLHVNPGAALTQSGVVMGTPSYMSPEQASGQKVDARTDLYSTGVMLYQMVTGLVPFTGESLATVLIHHIQSAPVPPRTRRPELPVRLDDAIMKALRKDRAERYPDAAAFAAELKAILSTPPPAPAAAAPAVTPPAGAPPAPRAQRDPERLPSASRSRAWYAVPLVLAAVAIAATAYRPCDVTRHPKPEKLKERDGHFIHDTDGAVMVRVPGGRFSTGSGQESDSRGSTCMPEFYIDRCEVTRGQYARFLSEARAEERPPAGPGPQPGTLSTEPTLPVTGVPYDDAAAYAKWAGRRLPTEDEWEKAARGMEDPREYPWGNELPDAERAVFHTTRPLPVGQRPKGHSPFQALDLSGNVAEWCQDWYDDRRRETRAVRGGSFDTPNSDGLRIWRRMELAPATADARVGFRTVLSP